MCTVFAFFITIKGNLWFEAWGWRDFFFNLEPYPVSLYLFLSLLKCWYSEYKGHRVTLMADYVTEFLDGKYDILQYCMSSIVLVVKN